MLTQDDMTTRQAGAGIPAIHGGAPVRDTAWPTYDHGDTWLSEQDEDAAIEAVRGRLYFRYDSRDFADTYAGRFEQGLCDYFGVRHALACASGTTAIALALLALDLPAGSVV